MKKPEQLIRLEELNSVIDSWSEEKQVKVIRSLIVSAKCQATDDEKLMVEALELGFELSLEEANKVGHQ